MELKNHIWDIYAIGRENNADTDVARDMFIENLRSKQNKYKGADVDYEALGEDWSHMTEAERYHERVAFLALTRAYLRPLSQAWQAGDRKRFDEIVDQMG